MGGGSGSGRGATLNMRSPPSVAHSSSYDGGQPDLHIRQNDSGEETVATTDSTRSSDTRGSDTSRRRGRGGGGKSGGGGRRARSLSPPHHVPKGLKNVGNTCYANATLQCLMSTALTHALLDPSQAVIFRRYASNPNILAAGSGSVDSDLDEDYEFASEVGLGIDDFGATDPNGAATPPPSPADEAEKEKRREERFRKKEARRRAKELQGMKETCHWLTGQLTDITREYTVHDEDRNEKPPDQTGLVAGFLGFFSSVGSSSSNKADKSVVVDPGTITRNVNKLCRTLRPYQQEDAHEFLRALLSTLTMAGQNRQLSSLFDGLLESAVTCKTCRYSSLTRDRYMDLSLDISDSSVTDLAGALHHFTKTETLDSSNMVECTKCQEKRIVTKGLRLATAPTILVCHLKRFSCDNYGRLFRLSKDVAFPQKLELDRYMSRANRSTPPAYGLVGVLVHAGQSCDRGHYYAFVRSGSRWYRCNDAVVTEVDVATVLTQKAYILVYEVEGMREKHGCESFGKYHSSSKPKHGKAQPKNKKNLLSRAKASKGKKDRDKSPRFPKKKSHVRASSAPRSGREPSPISEQRKAALEASSSRTEATNKAEEVPGDCLLMNLLSLCTGAGDSLCGGSAQDAKSEICVTDDDDVIGEADDGPNPAMDRRRNFQEGSSRNMGLESADLSASLSWDPSMDDDAGMSAAANRHRHMPPLPPSRPSKASRRGSMEHDAQEDSLDHTWHYSTADTGGALKPSKPNRVVKLQPNPLDEGDEFLDDHLDVDDSLDKTWHNTRYSTNSNGKSNQRAPEPHAALEDSLDHTWHSSTTPGGASPMKKSISSTNLHAAERQATKAYRRRRRETEEKKARLDNGADTDQSTSGSELDDSYDDKRSRSNSAPCGATHRRSQSSTVLDRKQNGSESSISVASPGTIRKRLKAPLPPLPN